MNDARFTELYDAAVADPHADEPRVALAEHLDARNDPWGAFIRAQMARRRAVRAGDLDAVRALAPTIDALERDHPMAWSNGLYSGLNYFVFGRGLVEKISIEARSYVERAAELHRRAPIRQLVTTGTTLEQLDAILARPEMTNLVHLAFDAGNRSPKLGDELLVRIASCPRLSNLRSLNVFSQDIGVRGLEALCASKELPALAYVNLARNRVDVPGEALEAKYGELAWLHPYTRLKNVPPRFDEL